MVAISRLVVATSVACVLASPTDRKAGLSARQWPGWAWPWGWKPAPTKPAARPATTTAPAVATTTPAATTTVPAVTTTPAATTTVPAAAATTPAVAGQVVALDYTQNYQNDIDTDFTSTSDGFDITFSGGSEFVLGRGWTTGRTDISISFSGSIAGTGIEKGPSDLLVAAYGWFTNPLVEYYVQEWSVNGGTEAGENLGNFTSDGSEYSIWRFQRVDKPSILGTSTFYQYISVRNDQRTTSGTITFANHVAAWQNAGLTIGTHNYQTWAVEKWGDGNGTASYTVSGSV